MNERQMDKITREKYPFNEEAKADRDLTKRQVVQKPDANILNSYRSITYNFTLAGLKKDYLKDPRKYRESELDLVILKSGGKGNSIISGSGPAEQDVRLSQRNDDADPRDRKVQSAAQTNVDVSNNNTSMIQGFNNRSPGRFDMFIENVEIDTLMAFTEGSGLF